MMSAMTTKIKHHIEDRHLLAYSAGALPEAFSLMVATHISLCDRCRAQVEAYDALGGAVLDTATDSSDAGLDRALAAIDAVSPKVTPRPDPAKPGLFPAPLRDYIGGDLDSVRWRPVGLGVRQAILPTSGEASARLLFIPAGAAVPDHGHRGTELTMVLQGAFSDETDRFARGDVETADEALNHMPVADISADCICLAVTDAPLRFNTLLPRLIQPFLRI
jgi:putative transcriptional regulator